MPDNEFQVEAIGAVYAQALVNEAQKRNILPEITEDVRGIAELLKSSKEFVAFTQALTIGEEERLASLTKIFQGRVNELTLQVILSMSRRDRLMFLHGFAEAFEDILKKMEGRIDVELVSAAELRPDVLERVKSAVGKSLGKAADIQVKIDPALIGGMTLTIGDTLIDGSVATQLERIEEQLKRGAGLKTGAVVA
jgi:F-type H+-transporting ATPase subunit delta